MGERGFHLSNNMSANPAEQPTPSRLRVCKIPGREKEGISVALLPTSEV
jgi:hypothetical protein